MMPDIVNSCFMQVAANGKPSGGVIPRDDGFNNSFLVYQGLECAADQPAGKALFDLSENKEVLSSAKDFFMAGRGRGLRSDADTDSGDEKLVKQECGSDTGDKYGGQESPQTESKGKAKCVCRLGRVKGDSGEDCSEKKTVKQPYVTENIVPVMVGVISEEISSELDNSQNYPVMPDAVPRGNEARAQGLSPIKADEIMGGGGDQEVAREEHAKQDVGRVSDLQPDTQTKNIHGIEAAVEMKESNAENEGNSSLADSAADRQTGSGKNIQTPVPGRNFSPHAVMNGSADRISTDELSEDSTLKNSVGIPRHSAVGNEDAEGHTAGNGLAAVGVHRERQGGNTQNAHAEKTAAKPDTDDKERDGVLRQDHSGLRHADKAARAKMYLSENSSEIGVTRGREDLAAWDMTLGKESSEHGFQQRTVVSENMGRQADRREEYDGESVSLKNVIREKTDSPGTGNTGKTPPMHEKKEAGPHAAITTNQYENKSDARTAVDSKVNHDNNENGRRSAGMKAEVEQARTEKIPTLTDDVLNAEGRRGSEEKLPGTVKVVNEPSEHIMQETNDAGSVQKGELDTEKAPKGFNEENRLNFERSLVDQTVKKAAYEIKNGKSEIRVDIEPDHLGPLKISVAMEHGKIIAKIMTENEMVKEVLDQNLALIRNELNNQGIEVKDVNVSVGRESQESAGRQARQDGRGTQAGNPNRPPGGEKSVNRGVRRRTYVRNAEKSVDYYI